MLGERLQQLLVHVGKVEALPEIGDGDLLVAHVSDANEGVVSLTLDGDRTLFEVADVLFASQGQGDLLGRCDLFGHLFTRKAD